MSNGKTKFRTKFWKTDWFLGLLVVIAVLFVHSGTDLTSTLERRYYDFASTSAAKKPADNIAIIAIDDQSIRNIGRWPWPRDVQAKLIDQLAAAKTKTIVNTVLFYEPEQNKGLSHLRKIKDLAALPEHASAPLADGVGKLVAEAEAALDTDAKLEQSLKKAGNVLLASTFSLGMPKGGADAPLPPALLKHTIKDSFGFSFPSYAIQHPLVPFADAAAGVGHLNQFQDPEDGTVRRDLLFVNYFGQAMPSMGLLAAAHGLNLRLSDLKVDVEQTQVRLGRLNIQADAGAAILPQFYGKQSFQIDSFYDVITGKIPADRYAGKIVIIGATAAGVGTVFPTPASKAMSPAEEIAHVTSSILGEHQYTEPHWGVFASMGIFLLVAGYLLILLPRLSAVLAAGVSVSIFVALVVAGFTLLAGAAMWIHLILPAFLLLVGHLALTTKRFFFTEVGKTKADSESAETNRMMGLSLQGGGRLDEAFDRFRRVPLDEQHGNAVMGNLYNLALDFERKRQFNKAQAVYEYMSSFDKDYKDLAAKLNRAKNLSETVILGGGGSHPGGTLLLDGGGVEKPMLGRYQIEKELGKGAMGVVYLGKDPKIGRVVAIKTMALSQEFEGDELDDARERFFREAETAGRLQHPNIVTIYDAGEEHDLAYIAMEFLKGKDLADFTRGGALLPMAQVASICARVAQALAYAHKQSVVHRDIKPANIMYEMASDTVKVTDFGIARITDSSKTKTGLVLGTPSFMSPEQIAGKKVDGRSDLYSLGVMLYQMLCGVLPFRGDSMAELMYKIANEDAPDIRIVRADIPDALADVVALSLSKRSETRYQDGDQFAADLAAAIAGPGLATASTSSGSGSVARPSVSDEKTMVMGAVADFDKTAVVMPSSGFPTGTDQTQVLPAHIATHPGSQTDVSLSDNAPAAMLESARAPDPFEKTIISSPRGPAGKEP